MSLDIDLKQSPHLNRLERKLQDQFPHVAYQYVDVLFSASDTDTDVATTLTPIDSEAIDYYQVRADRPCQVYSDHSSTRRPWGKGYVILRCSEAAQVRVLLIERKNSNV